MYDQNQQMLRYMSIRINIPICYNFLHIASNKILVHFYHFYNSFIFRIHSQHLTETSNCMRVSKLGKMFTGLTYKLLFSFPVISHFYRSFIPNNIIYTEYHSTQWITKLPWCFGIHRVRLYLVNATGLVGIVNATVYKSHFNLNMDK